ncbi:TetR family transcriptional regulator [Embleya scabrispora]|uniref:TetR family transcriptional regulator n=1 Tax=Embleya scabrispora TaxID=159449 RepID=A0A1T3NI89_9ACTN|nr:TetR family transcriptional regulator C-terminal domain-containing protein [Embleya scabrispora]OPC76559.1 TetR family transcriptional regulator [Embleya scabrispora]
MARPSKKTQLLAGGTETVRRLGLTGASVRDITTGAGVPLGSFSNHFASKEAFGLEVLDGYFGDVLTIVATTLEDETRPPLERLRAYFDAVTARLENRGWRDGCLIGNTSLDSTEHSELLRNRIAEYFARWREPFARCLEDAVAAGDVRPTVPVLDLADFLLASWHGAILRMKVERDPEPLERFKAVVFTTVLAPRPDR